MKLFLLLIVSFAPVLAGADEAEVFKCKSAKNEITYQSTPCGSKQRQKVITIDAQSPEEKEKSEAELRNWQEQEARQDAEDAIRMQEEEKRQMELERQQAQAQETQQMQRQAIQSQRNWNPFYRAP